MQISTKLCLGYMAGIACLLLTLFVGMLQVAFSTPPDSGQSLLQSMKAISSRVVWGLGVLTAALFVLMLWAFFGALLRASNEEIKVLEKPGPLNHLPFQT